MKDITTKADIESLVARFYDKLLNDAALSQIFAHLDLADHLPRVAHFWAFVLLDEEGYRTNVFEKHLTLPLKAEHFDMWLGHWLSSVDELFAGEKAEMAKQRAISLVYTFKTKWKSLGRG